MLKRAWRCLFLLYALKTRSRARVRIIGIYCNVTITIIISAWQIPIIRTTPVPLWGHNKKRHLHALRIVSFMYNPGAKRRGYLLSSTKTWDRNPRASLPSKCLSPTLGFPKGYKATKVYPSDLYQNSPECLSILCLWIFGPGWLLYLFVGELPHFFDLLLQKLSLSDKIQSPCEASKTI